MLGIAGLLLSGCGQKRCHSRGSMSRRVSRALVGVPRFASGQFVKTKDTASSRDRNGPVLSCSGDQTWKTPQNSWTAIGQSTSSPSTPSDPCSVVQTVTESFAIASVMRSWSASPSSPLNRQACILASIRAVRSCPNAFESRSRISGCSANRGSASSSEAVAGQGRTGAASELGGPWIW